MPKCLIIDGMHDSIQDKLGDANIEIDYKPDISREQILNCVGEYEILVVRSKTPIDKELIDLGKKLRFVARAGAGTDNLDLEYLKSRGIEVINAPEGNRDAVGDHTVGMVLVLLNKIHIADRQIRQSIWDREGNRGTELHEKTVGIVGYGNMGQAFAKRLQGFGCNVLAYDKYKINFSDQYVKAATMNDLFREVDILSMHIPLTEDTFQLVNEEYLNNFIKKIYLINMSRGEIVPMKSAVYGLDKGIIMAVALDVLECEDLARLNDQQKIYFERLTASDQVLFTPHVGGWSYESYKKISEVLADKIKRKIQ